MMKNRIPIQFPTDEMNSDILWPGLSASMEKTKIAVATTLTIP